MKKIANKLFALTIVGAFLMSCGSNNTKDMLAQKWQVSEFKVDGIDAEIEVMKAQADTTKDSIMKSQIMSQVQMYTSILEGMKKSTFEYKSDGAFEAAIFMMGQVQNVKGTWTISEDGKTLVVVDNNQKASTMLIDELSADKLAFSTESGGKKASYTLVSIQ